MKKLLFLLMAVVFTFSAYSQPQWVSFSGGKPGEPEVTLLNSDAQSVTFEISIPGIYTLDTTVKGMNFTRLILPGGSARM